MDSGRIRGAGEDGRGDLPAPLPPSGDDDRLRPGLPNKGSLSQAAVDLVREAGYHCRRYSRELVVRDKDHSIEYIFLRPKDIAIYVSRGLLDLGITGRDLALDSRATFEELLPLQFGRSRFQ
jgi:ATP phosphoribosyltransferase